MTAICSLCDVEAEGVAYVASERRDLCADCAEVAASVPDGLPSAHLGGDFASVMRPALDPDTRDQLRKELERSSRPRKGSALHALVPVAGADRDELLAWLTAALRLPVPLARLQRWGTHDLAPVALSLADGRRVRFEEAGHIAHGPRLARTVMAALGTDAPSLPLFTAHDAQDVYGVIVRACDLTLEDDEVERTRDWQTAVGGLLRPVHFGDYSDQPTRWRALTWLRGEPRFDSNAVRLAQVDDRYAVPAVTWQDGSSYVRVDDAEAVVRGVLGQRIAPQTLVARFAEAGWGHMRAECRRPGSGRTRPAEDRVRVSIFSVPEDAAGAPREGVSPTSPDLPHAHARQRARKESWGSLGTPAGRQAAPAIGEAGDTDQAGDTKAVAA